MKLIYCTSLDLPPFGMANRMHILEMAKSFSKHFKNDFFLGGRKLKLDYPEIQTVDFKTAKSYKLSFKYLKFIKANNITHAYSREPFLLAFMILYNKIFFRLKVEFIYEVHAIFTRNMADKIFDYLLAKWSDRITFITASLRDDYIKKYKINKKKALIAPDAVNLNIFDIKLSKEDARKKLNLPLDKKIIGYCGRFRTMDMEKGIIDIFKALKTLDDDIVFVAMGGKPRHVEYYSEKAKFFRVDNKSIIRGHFTQDIVALYQKAADVLLMPFPDIQHYRYYMSPMKMFEYMASKRPIITSDLPSIREVLNEKSCIFCKPGDPVDLAEKIKLTLSNSILAEQIAGQAYEDVQNYTWDKRVEKIISFL